MGDSTTLQPFILLAMDGSNALDLVVLIVFVLQITVIMFMVAAVSVVFIPFVFKLLVTMVAFSVGHE